MNKINEKQRLNNPEFDYQNRLFWFTKAMWRVVEQDWQQHLEKYQLTINEYSVLRVVSSRGACSITDVSKYGLMHISTAMNRAKYLMDEGLVVIQKTANDNRITMVKITEKGEALLWDLDSTLTFDNKKTEEEIADIEMYSGVKPMFPDVQRLIFTAMLDEKENENILESALE